MPTEDRGLIVAGKYRNLDLSQLRAWLMFWDELIAMTVPNQWDFIHGEGEFLIREGIMSRHPVGTSRNNAVLSAGEDPALVAFQEMEHQTPGKWSIALTKQEPLIYSNVGRSVLVNLYDALPVPTRDVPLEDVLSFRQRRRSEQLALRHHLEAIYQRIIQAGDGPLALRSETAALASAAADAVTVLDEARIPFQFAGVEAKLNWTFDIAPAAFGAALGALFSLPGALVGAGAGLLSNLMPKIEISTGAGLAVNRANDALPLAYLVHMAREI